MENVNTLDLLSKLLAMENIVVLREKVPTASFDLQKRILRLPILINMSQEEELMMALHEVGHALETTEEYMSYIEAQKGIRKSFSGYMNILEDVRIERIMKKRYPGSRRDFHIGYKMLNERDFFGIAGKDLSTYTLIDRINLYYKAGMHCGVRFTSEEMELVRAADNTETLSDVNELAIRVYDFAKAQNDAKPSINEDISFEDDEGEESVGISLDEFGSDEFGESGEEGDESEIQGEEGDENEEIQGNGSGEQDKEGEESNEGKSAGQEGSVGNDDELASRTQEEFDRNVEKNTQIEGREFVYVKPTLSKEAVFEDYKTVVRDIRDNFVSYPSYELRVEDYNQFRQENRKAVAHLVKEFEMRKAAARYSRNQVAATGSLNMKAIHKFRTSDDIFRKLDIVRDDQSHGFVMLLDWSGSMDAYLRDAVCQVLTLSQFCRRVNIPFKVIAFSDRQRGDDFYENKTVNDDPMYARIFSHGLRMITMLDSRMSASEYELVSKMMFTRELTRLQIGGNGNRFYELNGTPLVESLVSVYNRVDGFKKELGVDKLTLITVTDGEGNGNNYDTGSRQLRWHQANFFLRDPASGRVIDIKQHQSGLQNAMVKLIKTKGIKTVGFFISPRGISGMTCVSRAYNVYFDWKSAVRSLTRNGYAEVVVDGYDKFFVIPRNLEKVETELEVDSKMSAAKIARAINSTFKSFNKSRVVLTKFIETVA